MAGLFRTTILLTASSLLVELACFEQLHLPNDTSRLYNERATLVFGVEVSSDRRRQASRGLESRSARWPTLAQ